MAEEGGRGLTNGFIEWPCAVSVGVVNGVGTVVVLIVIVVVLVMAAVGGGGGGGLLLFVGVVMVVRFETRLLRLSFVSASKVRWSPSCG